MKPFLPASHALFLIATASSCPSSESSALLDDRAGTPAHSFLRMAATAEPNTGAGLYMPLLLIHESLRLGHERVALRSVVTRLVSFATGFYDGPSA